MSLYINEDDLECRFEDGGSPVWEYEGRLFTGILFCNEADGTLAYEQECENGYENGWYCSYHTNGRKDTAFKRHHNHMVAGTYKRWDEDGKLLGRM